MTPFEQFIFNSPKVKDLNVPGDFEIWLGDGIHPPKYAAAHDGYGSKKAAYNSAIEFVRVWCEISKDFAEQYVKLCITGYVDKVRPRNEKNGIEGGHGEVSFLRD